jgi:hypothetical protein
LRHLPLFGVDTFTEPRIRRCVLDADAGYFTHVLPSVETLDLAAKGLFPHPDLPGKKSGSGCEISCRP